MSKPRRAGYARPRRRCGESGRRLCSTSVCASPSRWGSPASGLCALHDLSARDCRAVPPGDEEARARSKAKRERRNHRTGSNALTIASSAARTAPRRHPRQPRTTKTRSTASAMAGCAAEAKVAAPKGRSRRSTPPSQAHSFYYSHRHPRDHVQGVHAARHPDCDARDQVVHLAAHRSQGRRRPAGCHGEVAEEVFMVLGDFFVSGVAASVVNSALKYLNSITVAFRQRLTLPSMPGTSPPSPLPSRGAPRG